MQEMNKSVYEIKYFRHWFTDLTTNYISSDNLKIFVIYRNTHL